MNTPGSTPAGRFSGTPYFDGGLYATIEPFELTTEECEALLQACQTDWSQVRPEIFGTLFQQSLGKAERHAFGAHYTSPADIARIIEPTLIRPWTQRIVDAWNSIPDLERALHDLSQLRVLDPACGCGNFLYMAYREMRRLERRIAARIEERRRGGRAGTYGLSIVSVDQFQGMDINAFACEVAKVTLMIAKKLSADELDDDANVLPLDNLESNIREADALFTDWPAFDICIGNPPYLGRRRVIEERGAEYSSKLARAYPLISGVSDYVCYWFRFAHDKMPLGGRAGLVGTNSIREGQSRQASLDYVVDNGGVITDAVSSLKWDGTAQVNVSIVNWVKNDDGASKVLWLQEAQVRREVDWIYPDLTADLDLRSARPLRVNTRPKRCFQGQTPGHVKGFVLSSDESVRARQAGAGSVVRPFITGDDLNNSGRPERWIIDFDVEDAATAKALDHAAFEQVKRLVLPDRIARAAKEEKANQAILAKDSCARVNWHHRNFLARWWQLSYRRADLLRALRPLDRYIALSRYAIADRPSVYAFLSTDIRPSDKVVAFAFDDDYSFGILTSSLHRLWFERRCTTLGQAVTYTNSTVFDTFPWPQNPTIEQVERIINVVARLQVHREERVAAGLTLGAQYDALRLPGQNRLRDLHTELDDCVRNAYGFEHPAEDLASLLALNELMVREELGGGLVRGPGPVANVQCKGTTVRVLG